MLAKRAECKRCTDESTIQTCAVHLPPIVRFKFFSTTGDGENRILCTSHYLSSFTLTLNEFRFMAAINSVFSRQWYILDRIMTVEKKLIITWYNNTYTHVKINYKLGSTCKHENVLRGPLILWPNVSQIANQYVHQVQGTEITERHSKITIRNAGSRHL